MARRATGSGDDELARALAGLAERVAYPPTPALDRSVMARLAAPAPQPAPARAPSRRLWQGWSGWFQLRPLRQSPALVTLLALVLLCGACLAVSPAARTAVAERLGLKGVGITYVPSAPAPTAGAEEGPLGARLQLGERLSLAEARERVSYAVLTPSLPDLGAPDEVYVRQPPAGGQVALLYRARPGWAPRGAAANEAGVGLLLTQFRGDLDPSFVGKMLGPDTRLQRVEVQGQLGFWIEGNPHAFFYRDATGQVRDETIRLAGNVLLWEHGDLTLRLEGARTREQALRIAASMR